MKFYKCLTCGNIITVLDGDVNKIRCCGKEMEELKANCVDAAVEKHVPTYTIDGEYIDVSVGEVIHPMTDEHYIMFIAQLNGDHLNVVKLSPGDKPTARFDYVKGSVLYAYCNLHGLWKRVVE